MKAGRRVTTIWLENKHILDNMNMTLMHFICDLKGQICRECSPPSQMGFHQVTNTSFHQQRIPPPDLSSSTRAFKNHNCPIWRKQIFSRLSVFPKPQLSNTSQGRIPDPKSPVLMRCHHRYRHLVCSDLTGTVCEAGLRSCKGLKSKKHRKFCWLRHAEVSFRKPKSWKKPHFPSQILESEPNVKCNCLSVRSTGDERWLSAALFTEQSQYWNKMHILFLLKKYYWGIQCWLGFSGITEFTQQSSHSLLEITNACWNLTPFRSYSAKLSLFFFS